MAKKIKVIKKLKLKEVYEIDGGFFYIEKKEIEDCVGRGYDRYFLKTSVSPHKMKLLGKFVDMTTPKGVKKK